MSEAFLAEPLPTGEPLPLVLNPRQPRKNARRHLAKAVSDELPWLKQELAKHGALLFRGYSLSSAKHFESIAATILPALQPYLEGQSPRTKVRGNVYTSTEYPKHLRITMHSELSYAKDPPSTLLFFCETPPTEGGETPVADCRTVYQRLPSDLRDKFEALGVKYVKNMPASEKGLGKTWMDHFETTDAKEVERYLEQNETSFTWSEDGALRTESIRPAVRTQPETGEKVWYNQANLWHVTNFEEQRMKTLLQICGEEGLPTHCYFGDGSKMTKEELDTVREVMWDTAVLFPWQKGDLLFVDNLLCAHGRSAFDGPRKILVGMG